MGLYLNRLVLISLLGLPGLAQAALSFKSLIPWSKSCAPDLVDAGLKFKDDQEAFETTMNGLAILTPESENDPAFQQIKYNAVPRVRWESNLASIAFYGGKGEGKTSLLNALDAMFYNYGLPPEEQNPTYGLDKLISDTGWTESTKRATVVIKRHQKSNSVMEDLHERLPGLEPHQGPGDANRGDLKTPIIYDLKNMPDNLAAIDVVNITENDPRVAQDPEYLAMAERILVSADIMLVILDRKTVNNPAILNSIRRTFDRYGRKQLVPVLQAPEDIPREIAVAELDRFANILYDRPVDTVGTPEGVVGMYLMPRDEAVRKRQAHVRMVPLNGSPEFVELMMMIANNAKGYKEAAALAATESFRMHAARTVREHYKRRLAMQIYYEAIQAAAYTIASENIANLDYEKAARYWRNRIENMRAKPMPWMNRTAEVLGAFERDIPLAWRAAAAAVMRRKNGLLTNEVADQMVLYSRQALIEMQNQLESGFLTLIANPDTPNRRAAGDQLQARLEAFWRYFPEERRLDDHCNAPPNRVCLHLPRRELLPPDVRIKFEQTLHSDATALMATVGQVEAVSVEPSSALVKDALVEIKNKRGLRVFIRDLFWDGMTAGSFTVPLLAIGASSGSFWSYATGALVGHVVARGVRSVAEDKRDRTYYPQLNSWFRIRQWSTIERVLSQYMFADVLSLLKPTTGRISEAMDSTQQALRFLDPTLPKLPLQLDNEVVHETEAKTKKAR